MRTLITGLNGFCGSHLAEYLLHKGHAVYGIIRHQRSDLSNISHLLRKVKLLFADITDSHAVRVAVSESKPNIIFHLGAQSHVPSSWTNPQATMSTNVNGTLNILEAVKTLGMADAVRIQVAGTSEEYGMVKPNECPISEDSPLKPLSPYGVSKVAADLLSRQYAASYGMNVVVTRAFNHSGARRGKCFAESDWARQVALIEAGKQEPIIKHGNLDSVRDYTHVADIVDGYLKAVTLGKSGQVYNLCSGSKSAWKMGDVLNCLVSMSNKDISTLQDPNRLRPSDVPLLIGDNTKANSELGWSPRFAVKDMLFELLEYWRNAVSERAGMVCGGSCNEKS